MKIIKIIRYIKVKRLQKAKEIPSDQPKIEFRQILAISYFHKLALFSSFLRYA